MQIIKVPGLNASGKTDGCGKAGNAILASLKEVHSNEQGKPIDVRLLDLEEIHLDNENLALTNKLIYENAMEAYDKNRVIFLGGDQSISFSLTRAFGDYCKNNRKEPCLIVFDSHADLMKSSGFPTNKEWLRGVVDYGFPSENILLVGLRNLSQDEIVFMKKNKIQSLNMNAFVDDFQNACDTLTEFASGKELYVSFDMGFVDPAFAPGTGSKEPGGLSGRESIHIIQRLNKMRNLRALDIVEVNPSLDKDEITVKLGAKILSELI